MSKIKSLKEELDTIFRLDLDASIFYTKENATYIDTILNLRNRNLKELQTIKRYLINEYLIRDEKEVVDKRERSNKITQYVINDLFVYSLVYSRIDYYLDLKRFGE